MVPQGGTIVVGLGPNDTTVEISQAGGGPVTKVKVEPGKQASIPVPNVPGGAVLYVQIGTGARARILVVEVISTLN